MKKLIAMILVLTLVLSMGALAFAVEYEDWSPVEIKKELTLTNAGTVNPAETFNFRIGAGTGLRDGTTIAAPSFNSNIFEIDIAQGELTGFEELALPNFTQVGVYTYPVTEVAGTTAGMTYDNGEYSLVVTVINNPSFGDEGEPQFLRVLTFIDGNDVKNESFKNEYSAGNLTVNKVIAGNYSDPNDEFEIIVTVTPKEGKTINAEAIVWNTTDVTSADGVYTATYTLKGSESFTIENLPYDVSYTVEETNPGEYEVTYSGNNENVLFESASVEFTVTNTRNTEINTGINLDNLPYVLILVGAAAGLVAFTIKRRPSRDE